MMGGAVNIDTAGIGTAVSSIGDLAIKLRTAFTGKVDPTLALQMEGHLADLQAAADTIQANINAVEAASPRLFVSGWRPAVGWLCVIAVFVNFIVVWIMKVLALLKVIDPSLATNMPAIPSDQLWPLMLGMLGIGTLRSVDKRNGVDTK
jgi:hypothetical protein